MGDEQKIGQSLALAGEVLNFLGEYHEANKLFIPDQLALQILEKLQFSESKITKQDVQYLQTYLKPLAIVGSLRQILAPILTKLQSLEPKLKDETKIERRKKEVVMPFLNIQIPKNWTVLVHGTNTAKSQWQGKASMLDDNELTIGRMGLSVVRMQDEFQNFAEEAEMLEKGIMTGGYNSASNFSRGGGEAVRIQVMMPDLSSRHNVSDELQAVYKEYMDMLNEVYWRNIKAGRHPLVPRKMVLVKIDEREINDARVITYVPEVLRGIYDSLVDGDDMDSTAGDLLNG